MNPSETEARLAKLLDEVEPGYYSAALFHSLLRLVVSTTFVLIPLRKKPSSLDVHLFKRDPDDLYYPKMLHPAGTVIRVTDHNLDIVFHRLVEKELSGMKIKVGPIFVGVVFDQIKRGKEISLIHWIEVESNEDMDFYNTSALPKDIIPTDTPRIELAVKHFNKFNDKNNG
jgi:hypothetical protein